MCSSMKIVAGFLPVLLYFHLTLADIIAHTPNGRIRGIELKTNGNTKYYAFWNIPYGKPPLGNLRFQAPQPADPWTGIRDGTKEGNSCVYMNNFSYYPEPGVQDEDCLYLSVYTPNFNTSAKLPVMFWIYGGGFRAGSGIFKFYGPQNLIDENVIVVTFNYRLGPLGFLSTGDNVISGNAGLKDQLLALQWTKNNIEHFGGDPEKITIFGESAGGMATGLHLVSEKARGLFRGAICLSGCTLSTTLSLNPRSFFYTYANVLNPDITEINSTEEVKDFLVNVPVETLIEYALQVDTHLFVPVLEVESDEAFITKPLYGLVESGKVNGEALLIGTTSEESLGSIGNKLLPTAISYDQSMEQLIPTQITLRNDSDIHDMSRFIKSIYLNDGELFQENLIQFLEYYSDNIFVRAAYKQAELQSNYQSVYVYRFSYYGTTSETRDYAPEGVRKVGHFSDLSYLFNMTQFPLKTENDDLVRRKYAKLWANFAKFLDPTPEEISLLDDVILPKTTDNVTYLLDIDTKLSIITQPEEQRMTMWTEFWQKYVCKPYMTF